MNRRRGSIESTKSGLGQSLRQGSSGARGGWVARHCIVGCSPADWTSCPYADRIRMAVVADHKQLLPGTVGLHCNHLSLLSCTQCAGNVTCEPGSERHTDIEHRCCQLCLAGLQGQQGCPDCTSSKVYSNAALGGSPAHLTIAGGKEVVGQDGAGPDHHKGSPAGPDHDHHNTVGIIRVPLCVKASGLGVPIEHDCPKDCRQEEAACTWVWSGCAPRAAEL